MDFFSKPVFPELSDVVHCSSTDPERHDILPNTNVVDDGLTSLMQMAESMEALLPPDISNDIFSPDISHAAEITSLGMLPSSTPTSCHVLPTLLHNREVVTSGNVLNFDQIISPHFHSNHTNPPQTNDGLQILSFLSRETSCEEISNDVSYATPEIPSSPTDIHPFPTNFSSSSTNNSSCSPVPVHLASLVNYSTTYLPDDSECVHTRAPSNSEPSDRLPYGSFPLLSQTNVCDGAFTPVSGGSPAQTSMAHLHIPEDIRTEKLECGQEYQQFSAYCQEPSLLMHKHKQGEETGRISKSRKTARKPKTYSKPVASRFCHICSRMPRRGQGSAICKRIVEGLCRKIVCEQCIREQGWDYELIKSDKNGWLCPHCADICPSRSQCHIYNRINARRKRTSGLRNATVANYSGSRSGINEKAILASESNLRFWVSSHNGIVDNYQSQSVQQILQPPPNFRLNLPLPYTQK